MWGFDDVNSSWKVVRKGSECFLRFPSSPGSPLAQESELSLHACLSILQPLERWRLDLALRATRGRRYPGSNPSLVPMPSYLKLAFPAGKWLVVNRGGWGRCPGMEDFSATSDFLLLENLFDNGSHAAVLDENFAVQAVSKIEVHGDLDWKHAIVDVRLWLSSEGDVIIAFLPYFLGEISNPLIAKLHLSATDCGALRAWISRDEVRRPQNCKQPEMPMKNLGFLQFGPSTFIMDRIYPTSVVLVNLTLLNASEETKLSTSHNHTFKFLTDRMHKSLRNESFAVLCADARLTLKANHSPWSDVRGQWPHFFIHNGPSPVWIDELQLFLGIGHMARGKRRSQQMGFLPDHYTHQFFALAGDDSQGGQAFRLVAASPEFCFSSAQAPQDCESIQFASTLIRDGNSLLVGYGVEDCDAFLQRFSLDQVLQSLLNVSDV